MPPTDQDRQAQRRPRSWARRIAVAALVIAATLAVVIAAGVLFRTDVVHAVVENRLAAMGFGEASFRVARVSGDEVIVAGLRIDESLSIGRLAVRYAPGELLQGRLRRIGIEGLRADLTRTGGAAESIMGASEPNGDPEAVALPAIPLVAIADARVRARLASADLTATINGNVGPTADGSVPLDLEIALPVAPRLEDITASVTGSLRVAPAASGIANGADPRYSASVRLQAGVGSAAFGGTTTRAVTLDAPVRIETSPSGTVVELTGPGRAAIGALTAGEGRFRARPFTLGMSSAGGPLLRLPPGAETETTLTHAVRLEPSRIVVESAGGETGYLPLSLETGDVSVTGAIGADGVYRAELGTANMRVSSPGRRFAAAGLEAALTLAPAASLPEARLKIASLRQLSPDPAIAPVSVTASLTPRGGQADILAEIAPAGTGVTLGISGAHDFRRGAGYADLVLRGADFQPGGLQPGSIVPALGQIGDAGGSLSASAALRWSGGITGTARIGLEDISASFPAGKIEGFGGAVAFSGLDPPTTPPHQRITIRRIEAGLALTDASLTFELLRDGALMIEGADAGFAGGRVRMSNQRIDPFAGNVAATVEVAGLDLARLVDLARLGGVGATGQLSGAVPIRISDGAVSVDSALLAAEGGGTLRIRSEQASRVLAQGGREVRLMLQALEDFRYETLTLKIDKAPGGDTVVALSTLGHNPDVLDGRPFQINVNLETNLDEVLAAVAEWYRLSGRALRDIVGGQSQGGSR